MNMHFGTQGGAMLSNTGSPSRLSAEGAALLGKTGPHVGYTKIFWVLDVDILFVCFVNKTENTQNTPTPAKSMTITLTFI